MCTKRRSNIDNKDLQEKLEKANTDKLIEHCPHCKISGKNWIVSKFGEHGWRRFICYYCGYRWGYLDLKRKII